MKKFLFTTVLLVSSLFLTSCSEDTIINNYDIDVENVTVDFGTQSILSESSGVFSKNTTLNTTSFDNAYQHVLPTEFKAYFISNETRGQYTLGEVISVIDVTTGMQQITIPKLSYKVYVTNYIKNDGTENQPYAWYTWQNSENQLPVTSPSILLYGQSLIDYKVVTQGTVTLENFHSAVMVKNNEAIGGTPFFNTGNTPYNLVANDSWYLLYIRNHTTSSQVPLSFQSPSGDIYQLNKNIEPNKIYQYTLRAVGDVDGNLEIVTVPLQEGVSEIIDILD